MRMIVAEMFVVYTHQPDYPGAFVVRRFTLAHDGPEGDFVLDDGPPALVGADIGAIRFLLHELRSGLVPIEVDAGEREHVAEVWWRVLEQELPDRSRSTPAKVYM